MRLIRRQSACATKSKFSNVISQHFLMLAACQLNIYTLCLASW
jgi:hypothetical protein